MHRRPSCPSIYAVNVERRPLHNDYVKHYTRERRKRLTKHSSKRKMRVRGKGKGEEGGCVHHNDATTQNALMGSSTGCKKKNGMCIRARRGSVQQAQEALLYCQYLQNEAL